MTSARFLSALTLLLLGGLSTFLLFPARDVPAAPSQNTCRDALFSSLQHEFDLYRRAVFGSTGSTLTQDGTTVLRTGGSMQESDHRGILETRGRLTSELVEPLVESYRTLRCRTLAVCKTLEHSLLTDESVTLESVQTLGCEPVDPPPMQDCRLVDSVSQVNVAELVNFCRSAVADGLAYERAALKTAVGYDAGYRALLQFSGMFDAFLEEAPVHTFLSLRQMAGLLGKLHQIPCFLGHCDLPAPLPSEE